ncbi:hypothetical protein [Martelella alba]|uniref:Uncharacterized protein n=1 Tax=Martelella alba TaxID=2590451 RepID=A0ABY2SFN4_9HYPH|nr:hypothetical protein [Martelella alba]TKI02883.1 hypothetical protein FCN80_23510 [Martelella alba]
MYEYKITYIFKKKRKTFTYPTKIKLVYSEEDKNDQLIKPLAAENEGGLPLLDYPRGQDKEALSPIEIISIEMENITD